MLPINTSTWPRISVRRTYIDDFRKKGGIVLFVTHDIHEFELCDRCYVMKDGRLSEYTYDGDLRKLAGMMT